MTVKQLKQQIDDLEKTVGEINDLKVTDIDGEELDSVIFHDPNGDNTECWISIEQD